MCDECASPLLTLPDPPTRLRYTPYHIPRSIFAPLGTIAIGYFYVYFIQCYLLLGIAMYPSLPASPPTTTTPYT
jgi:hypothetical protein